MQENGQVFWRKKKVTLPWKVVINSCCPNTGLRYLDTCLKNNSV